MQAYRIVNWWKFELLKNGKLATEKTKMQSLRIKPLVYVRFPVHGHNLSADYRRMVNRAGPEMAAACDGVYKMLVGLAASQVREYRGWILDDRQRPLDREQIAELLCLSKEQISQIFEVLTDEEVNWVRLEEFPEALRSQITKTGNELKTYGSQITKTGNEDEKTEKREKSGDFSRSSEALHKSIYGHDLPKNSQIKNFGNFWEKKGSPLNETETETVNETETVLYNVRSLNETETRARTRARAREREDGQRENVEPQAQPAPASASVSGSDSGPVSASQRPSVSDSDSVPDSVSQPGPAGPGADSPGRLSKKEIFDIMRERNQVELKASQILKINPRNNSDTTTISDIYSQLAQRIIGGSPYPLFEYSLNTARQCWRGDKPIAMFVAAMKKPPFHYVPKKLSVVPGKFSRFPGKFSQGKNSK